MWKSLGHVLGYSKRGITRHLAPHKYLSNAGKSLTEAYTDSPHRGGSLIVFILSN